MLNGLLFSTITALGWAISVILEKKYLLSLFKPVELILMRGPFFIFFFLYYVLKNNSFYNKLKNISLKMFIILSLSILAGFIALFFFFKVLNNKNAFYCVSLTQPLFVVLTILLSSYFLNEKINLYQFIGIVLVISGILTIQLNSKI